MKKSLLFSLTVILLSACKPEVSGDPTRFQQGTFKIPAGSNYGATIIRRIDSLQIETYTKKVDVTTDSTVYQRTEEHIDTLIIKWKNNFFYTLKMKSPKTDLDKDPIYVQITKVTDSSYSFTAKIGYSKFKQDGTVYKID